MELESGTVPCDLLLLAGKCVLNESMLTGESAAVLKSSIQPDFSPQSEVSLGLKWLEMTPGHERGAYLLHLFAGAAQLRVT